MPGGETNHVSRDLSRTAQFWPHGTCV